MTFSPIAYIILSSNGRAAVGCELERTWNEVVVAYFKLLSKNVFTGNEVKRSKSQWTHTFGRDSNLEPPRMRTRNAKCSWNGDVYVV